MPLNLFSIESSDRAAWLLGQQCHASVGCESVPSGGGQVLVWLFLGVAHRAPPWLFRRFSDPANIPR